MPDPERRSRRAGLRARTSTAFALLALLLSVTLALLTYELARQYLLSKRESLATRQAVVNARTVARVLQDSSTDPTPMLANVATTVDGTRLALRLDGRWFAASVDSGRKTIPRDLQTISGSRIQRQRLVLDGDPFVVVAVPIAPKRGAYYEVVPLRELEATLGTLATILVISAVITTLGGAAVGRAASRRVLRPVRETARTAAGIAAGNRELRLTSDDADLLPLVTSFNEMVDALQERIEREARFASDVSHELRNPLTAIRSAMDVLDHRVGDDARAPLEILRRQTSRFEQLVLDLLEISRFDAGATALQLEATDPAALVRDVLRRTGDQDTEVVVSATAPASVSVDRRRIERVVTNLVENAAQYAGHATRITIDGTNDVLSIACDDNGPGVPSSERALVFERFHRGLAGRGAMTPGTGLGLAIAREHCRLHGGDLDVTDNPAGGARFVVRIPWEPSS